MGNAILSILFNLKEKSIPVLKGLNLDIEDASIIAIIGQSGCGKTTLLRILAGLEEPTSGTVCSYEDKTVLPQPKTAIMFQEPRLMPWLTLRDNMAFSLIHHPDKKYVKSIVTKHLEILGLTQFETAYPSQISGGMAQRVALGRTLCYDPDIILMDEPLSALDFHTRETLQDALTQLFSNCGKTIIFVTHDIDEALYIGQQILVMNEGHFTYHLENNPCHAVRMHAEAASLKQTLQTFIRAGASSVSHENKDSSPMKTADFIYSETC